jgi:hypothetical protein
MRVTRSAHPHQWWNSKSASPRRCRYNRHSQGFADPKQSGDVDGSFGCNADAHLAALFIYADEKNGKTEIPAICGQASSGFLGPPATLCCATCGTLPRSGVIRCLTTADVNS